MKEGEKVKRGQELISFDINGIKKSGYKLTTPMVITNHENFNIKIKELSEVTSDDIVMEIEEK